MSCQNKTATLTSHFTAGDLESPISVTWEQAVTTETSEIVIDRPAPYAAITVPGVLTDAAVGTYVYAWRVGDLVAGENQMAKARLYDGTRRKSTMFFRFTVDEDIS